MITDFAVTKKDTSFNTEVEVTRDKKTRYYHRPSQSSLNRIGLFVSLHPYRFSVTSFFYVNRLTVRYFRRLDKMKG